MHVTHHVTPARDLQSDCEDYVTGPGPAPSVALWINSESFPCPTIHAGSPDHSRHPSEHLHSSLHDGVARSFRPNQVNLGSLFDDSGSFKKPLGVGTAELYLAIGILVSLPPAR